MDTTTNEVELSEQDLEVVVGGLARTWRGVWDAVELEAPPATAAPLADSEPPTVTGR
jgi:hypothetical protein